MADSQDQEKLAAIGLEIEHFLQTDGGKYVIQHAEDDMERGMQELKSHDPHDAKGIQILQNRIHRAESIMDWFDEVITAGLNAQQMLDLPEE